MPPSEIRNQKTNLLKEDVNCLTNFTIYIMNAEGGGGGGVGDGEALICL